MRQDLFSLVRQPSTQGNWPQHLQQLFTHVSLATVIGSLLTIQNLSFRSKPWVLHRLLGKIGVAVLPMQTGRCLQWGCMILSRVFEQISLEPSCLVGWNKQLVAHISQQKPDAPFSEEQLLPFKSFVDEFLSAQGFVPCWNIPDDQPLLCRILTDRFFPA